MASHSEGGQIDVLLGCGSYVKAAGEGGEDVLHRHCKDGFSDFFTSVQSWGFGQKKTPRRGAEGER